VCSISIEAVTSYKLIQYLKTHSVIVLFVQQKPVLSAALQLTFQRAGHRLVFCRNQALAHEYLEDYMPNLVVTELMTGYELPLIAEVKRRNIPIIVLSPFGYEEELQRAFDHGADDYMHLPLSLNELTLRIRKLMLTQQVGKA
jgi:DNA-binding response OmpR family regulator